MPGEPRGRRRAGGPCGHALAGLGAALPGGRKRQSRSRCRAQRAPLRPRDQPRPRAGHESRAAAWRPQVRRQAPPPSPRSPPPAALPARPRRGLGCRTWVLLLLPRSLPPTCHPPFPVPLPSLLREACSPGRALLCPPSSEPAFSLVTRSRTFGASFQTLFLQLCEPRVRVTEAESRRLGTGETLLRPLGGAGQSQVGPGATARYLCPRLCSPSWNFNGNLDTPCL